MTEQEILNKIEGLSNEERALLALKVKRFIDSGVLKLNTDYPKKLVAYVKTNEVEDINNLKQYLKSKLPEYMVPSSIYEIEEFPLLPNGKVDRNKIKILKVDKTVVKNTPINNNTTNTKIETQLIRIWEEVLGFSPIHTDDNFFEIGGDSILSIQIIAKARKEGLSFSANQLFENQTIAELSIQYSKNLSKAKTPNHLTVIRKYGDKSPLFCIHSGGGHVFFYGPLKHHLKEGRPIYAINPSDEDIGTKLHKNVEEMAKDYLKAIKKIQPNGPYNILVYCFSTSVGNEISILLEAIEEKINLIVVDTMASAWNAADNNTLIARTKFFFKRLVLSPVKTIKLYFQERYYLIEPLIVKLFGKDHEKELEKLKANLRKMSVEYKFKPHNGHVSLILTQKEDKNFEDFIIQSWKKLAKGGVTVTYTKGHHTTLFEKNDIKYVSEKIDLSIMD